MYENAEILSFLKKRLGVLDGVAITGGEPTLMSGLYDFIKQVKEMGYSVKLDSNGTRPDVLRRLIDDGLVDYVVKYIGQTMYTFSPRKGSDLGGYLNDFCRRYS